MAASSVTGFPGLQWTSNSIKLCPVALCYEGLILRVTPNVRRYELATRHDLKVLLPCMLQRRPDELACDALPLQLLRHLRVRENNLLSRPYVLGHRQMAANLCFKTVRRLVVLNFDFYLRHYLPRILLMMVVVPI